MTVFPRVKFVLKLDLEGGDAVILRTSKRRKIWALLRGKSWREAHLRVTYHATGGGELGRNETVANSLTEIEQAVREFTEPELLAFLADSNPA